MYGANMKGHVFNFHVPPPSYFQVMFWKAVHILAKKTNLLRQMQDGDVFVWLSILIKPCKLQVITRELYIMCK